MYINVYIGGCVPPLDGKEENGKTRGGYRDQDYVDQRHEEAADFAGPESGGNCCSYQPRETYLRANELGCL